MSNRAEASKLQRGMSMKRNTAVFLAALSLVASSGCGLAANEVIDGDGNVIQVSENTQALSDPYGNPVDPNGGDITPLPPLQLLPPAPGGEGTPPGTDPSIALPQDPIPLIDPARPSNGPRVGPVTQ